MLEIINKTQIIKQDMKDQYELYEVENLDKARRYLSRTKDKVILSNPEGSTRYYGMRVIDYIFRTLQQEYPDKIQQIVVNAFDDYAAFITAREIGYQNINFVKNAY